MDKTKFTGEVSEKELSELMEQATKQGAVLANFFFDAHGPSEEGVRNSLVDFVGRISKEKGVLYCKGEIEKSLEKDGLYSSYSEVHILTESFLAIMNLALKYGPVGIDLLKPREIRLNMDDAQVLLLDASQASQDYTTYILQKVLPEKEKAQLQEQLRRRSEYGKELRERPADKG